MSASETIRPLTPDDIYVVAKIHSRARTVEYANETHMADVPSFLQDEKMTRDFLNSEIWVYQSVDGIQGFIGNGPNTLTWLYIDPVAHRKGIASKLVHHLIQRMPGNILLSVIASNRSAQAFYKRFGFEVVRETTSVFGGVVHSVKHMERLSSA